MINTEITKNISPNNYGITVGVKHTGEHYPDDLSEDGMLYHYPNTNRQPGRDLSEIEACKNACKLGIPVFAILPGQKNTKRKLELGWLESWDDDEEIFLILFGDQKPHYDPPKEKDAPFKLHERRRKQESLKQN